MSIFTWQINVNEALSYINTEFLSKIKEGMVITKDYALDLWARYSQYAMTVDAVMLLTQWILFIVTIFCMKKMFKRCRHLNNIADYDTEGLPRILFAAYVILPIVFLAWTIHNAKDLVKRKFVPEVQMYQVIMDIKNGNTNGDGN